MDMEVVKRFRRRLQDVEDRAAGLETELLLVQTIAQDYERLRRDIEEIRAALDALVGPESGSPGDDFANPS